jgi:hypothetical protein
VVTSAGGTGPSATAFVVPAPLPVQLTAFTVQVDGPDAALRWATASERNHDHFDVEVSTDGRAFTRVGAVPGHGTSSRGHFYTYQDANLARYPARLLYYRLRQVDADSTATYSPVRTVQWLGAPTSLSLYPNPTRQLLAVQGAPPGAIVQVLNTLGQVVLSATADADGRAPLTLPTHLTIGVYAVRTGSQVVRLFIE